MRPRPTLATLTLALLIPLGACDAGPRSAASDEGGVVARAGDRILSVDEAADLLADRSQLPNEERVVRAAADLWLDYMLLGQAAAEDSTLSQLDLEPVIRRRLEQELVMELRDSVVQVDTTLTEEELRELWNRDAPGVQVKARHILLTFPDGATEAQRDSVEQLALQLRSRIQEGEGFVALAQEYSQDTGTAQQGGDLGWFGRGQMVPGFEEAAFSLEPGAISEPVETPFGLHLITVEDRRTPDFEEDRSQFERQVKSRRVFEAESTYVAAVADSADIQPAEDALEILQQLALDPGVRLSPAARKRPLATYEGGVFTVGEYREFLRSQAPRFRNQVAQAPEDQLESFVTDLARSELLVQMARDAGIEIRESRRDSLVEQARTRLVLAAEQLGLSRVQPGEGESRGDALERRVRELLVGILSDEESVVPLGSLGYTLRSEMGAELYEVSFSRVVDAVARARSQPTQGTDSAAPRDAAPGTSSGTPPGAAPEPDSPGAIPPDDGA